MAADALFHWSYRSKPGARKPRNDDSAIAFASGADGAEILPEDGSRTVSKCDLVFAISDGMSGGNAGNLASALLLREMSQKIPETFKAAATGFFPDFMEHLSIILRDIHQQINEAGAASQDQKGMAATIALAWFTPESLYIANAGDSRIYLFRDGTLQQLTKDHTSAWNQWKRGEISEIQYLAHPRRSALYEIIGGGHQNINPHLAQIHYQHGDRFLICSDGLIDGVWETTISSMLAACRPDPTETVEKLLTRSFSNAGKDDTTLAIITVEPI